MSKVIGDDGARTMNTTKHSDTPTRGFTTAGGAKIDMAEKALLCRQLKPRWKDLVKENIPKRSDTKLATS